MPRDEEDLEDLKEEAKKTHDPDKQKKLQQAVKSEETKEQVLAEQAQIEKEQAAAAQMQQQNQQQNKPKPQWLTPEEKVLLHLVSESKAFNEKNFLANLVQMGFKDITKIEKNVKYQLSYNINKFINLNVKNLNVNDSEITTNDLSANGLANATKLASAAGATALNYSSFIKAQANNPNLNNLLTDAYKAAKNEGLEMQGLDEKEEDIKRMLKGFGKTPTLRRGE